MGGAHHKSRFGWLTSAGAAFVAVAALSLLAFAQPASAATTTIEQDRSGISWAGRWNQAPVPTASGLTRVVTRSEPATCTFAFSGTSVAWVAEKGTSYGRARVYLDGNYKATVNLYSTTTRPKLVVWSSGTISSGTHKLMIVATNTRDSRSKSEVVNIDAFKITGTYVRVLASTRSEENNSHLFFDGAWKSVASSVQSGGRYRRSSRVGDEYTCQFSGTAATLVGSRAASYGRMEVFLDGVSQGTVNCYAKTQVNQRVLWSRSGLAARTHTLRVRVSGTRQTGATATWVGIDAVDLVGSIRQSWRRAEETDSRITWAGSWAPTTNSWMSAGAFRTSSTGGSVMRARFDGTAVRIIGRKAASYGQMEIAIDGVSKGIVDLRSPSTKSRTTLWSTSSLTNAQHDIEVRVLGTKSRASSWHTVGIDAVDTRGTFEQAPVARLFRIVDEDDQKLALSSQWGLSSDSAAANERVAYATKSGAKATLRFKGTGVRYIGPKRKDGGRFRVSLDGDVIGDFSQYSSTAMSRRVLWSRGAMSDTTHTVTIESLGTKDPASIGTYVRLDQLHVVGTVLDPARPSGWRRAQHTDRRIVRTEVWTGRTASSALSGSDAISRDARAIVTVNFDGTGASWIGSRGPTGGLALVSLDGKPVATVNLYHYYWMYGRALYRVSGLTDGPHTLTIRVLGEKDDRSTSFWVPFDGVEVVGTILQASPMSQETDWRLSWTGTWTNISNAAYSGGHIKRASAAGRMKATFTGTQGVVLASVGPSWGKARVRVDGGAAKTIDLYRSTASSRRSIFSTGSLPYGTHTITVEWTGARNAKATTTRINVDALKVAGIVTPHTSKAKARDTIVRTAIDQLGDKYVWAAVGPTTFDCSGLVLYCYRAAGISLPHYSGYQWDLCSPKNVPVSQLLPGDLVFTDSPSYIHHVGIYIGKGITINAPGSGRYVEYRDADTYGCAGRIKSSLWP